MRSLPVRKSTCGRWGCRCASRRDPPSPLPLHLHPSRRTCMLNDGPTTYQHAPFLAQGDGGRARQPTRRGDRPRMHRATAVPMVRRSLLPPGSTTAASRVTTTEMSPVPSHASPVSPAPRSPRPTSNAAAPSHSRPDSFVHYAAHLRLHHRGEQRRVRLLRQQWGRAREVAGRVPTRGCEAVHSELTDEQRSRVVNKKALGKKVCTSTACRTLSVRHALP